MNTKVALSFCVIAGAMLAALPLTVSSEVVDDSGCPNIAGFMVIGELEHVTIKPEDLRLQARIDTGAETSSLGVSSMNSFERDGKKWLHFSVATADGKKSTDFEKPLLRTAKIKRHGAEAVERPVVKLKILLGNKEMEREFTLADRSKYKYPVLIGRNVLASKFLVDVNRKYSGQATRGKEE